jgi:molybdopterin converting factor small subunit
MEFEIEEDVNALLEGEELSEEFQEKAKVIFEAALRSKVSEIQEAFEAQYEQKLIEEVEEIKEALSERVDSYLEYVAEEWINENNLAVQAGLKEELTESFMTGLKGLFEEHYVTIPEDKYDVLNSMVEKLDEMETKLNEQIEKNVSLNKRLAESVANGIFDEISEGLALSQKDKLASLSESVEFESEEEYREKLEMLRESYFPSKKATSSAKTETLSEGVDSAPEGISNAMAGYLKTLSKFSK